MGIDLLRLEMDTLWGQGRFGRHRTHLAVVLAAAADGEEMRFGPGVSEQLRAACAKLANSLFDCAEVLEQFQPCELGGGPSYLVSNPIEPPLPPGLQIIRSHQRSEQTLPTSLEPWWTEEEWRELLAARLGPWAMGLLDDQIVSICHTPVAGAKAAEAGIWTHPEFRRRGFAIAATAAWASVAAQEYDVLFYSTSFDNLASQSVAKKLGLVRLGEMRQILRTVPK